MLTESLFYVRLCVEYFFLRGLVDLLVFGYAGSSCCTRAFSSCGERGLLFAVGADLLRWLVTCPTVEHGLR